ncbi:23S rRNA (uracil(1939)-C(5))-methyltransferase RlmD [Flavonifractor sp. An92]|uniref:23S rRNA (uracil(1939)-C(5))-methyltransferase RlmD n=1 Tax=Flavonifractor sp. An92 TaxID=1965666 RepID=UPI000B39C1CE|nr:23S rRNA (uracil(1939)-C(5))-methyltransferase RlmD [Flavonifractor sp. An92]OUN08184.1 23S rRNA (uracil(1939)-C(5))-methyltransferase RlmD [Flavonifractor sp. An92]
MDRMMEHTTQRLHIESYASDGAGVARLDGAVVFVKGAVRGETCQVYLDKVGRSAIWGHVTAVEVASSSRVEPDCPYYERCGGCCYRHMTYAEELEAKRQRVEDAIQRIGGVDLTVPPVLGAAHPERYRNKAQFPVAPGPRIGFYQKRTHAVTDVEDCLLQSEAAARLRATTRSWMKQFHIPAYLERSGKGLVRHVYVRTNRKGQSLYCLLINGSTAPRLTELVGALRAAEPGLVGVVLGINEKRNNVILGDSYRTLWGQDYLDDTLCGLTFRLSVPSFYQVNPEQTEVLYRQAAEYAGLTGGETVLDLYCGIGTIGLTMAGQAGTVIGAEVVPEAVEDAKQNAQRNGVTNARFLCGDAGEAARQLAAEGVRPDVVCVDPPRKGLSEDVVETVAEMAPERIVYVSCDPATLGRDLERFARRGYAARQVTAVDLFPRTAHVETVVQLDRIPSDL